jgi:sterol desaturase/sphingolipid hydroxylase (fatty acid hydroxylase superfamily)
MFGRQDLNMARTFGTGVPIWSAYEILILWIFADGWVPMASLTENRWWLLIVLCVAKIFHEAHFYAIHRLIHTRWLYRHVHSVHTMRSTPRRPTRSPTSRRRSTASRGA